MTALPSASATGTLLHSNRIALALICIDIKEGLRKHFSNGSWRERGWQFGGLSFGLLFLAVLHYCAFALFLYTWASPTSNQRDLIGGLSTSLWSFLLFVMISGGLVRALVVLHEQDDSNLLLSSPTSPRAILAARLFGSALQSCLVDGFIIVPYINVRFVVLGGWHFQYLWGYPVWFALAVIVTSIDGLFSFGMVRWLGLRKARLLSQTVPFFLIFGVTFFAGSLSLSIAQMNMNGDQTHMPPEMQAHFIALYHTPLSWLARAASGSPVYLAMIFSTALGLALITLRLTERAFVEGTQHLAENVAPPPTDHIDAPFHSSVLTLEIRKNVRLVMRTPMMIIQCLAQVLTPVGIAFVLGRDDISRGLSFFVIFASGVLAGMFTIAAGTVEECHDLLNMSPRGGTLFRFGKMLSGCLWPVALSLLIGVGLLLFGDPLLAGAVLLGGIPLAVASSLVGEVFASGVKPGQRPKLLSDPIMMVPLLGMQITSGLVAGVTVFAAQFSFLLLLAALGISYFVLILLVALAQLRKPLFW